MTAYTALAQRRAVKLLTKVRTEQPIEWSLKLYVYVLTFLRFSKMQKRDFLRFWVRAAEIRQI